MQLLIFVPFLSLPNDYGSSFITLVWAKYEFAITVRWREVFSTNHINIYYITLTVLHIIHRRKPESLHKNIENTVTLGIGNQLSNVFFFFFFLQLKIQPSLSLTL